MAFRAKNFMPAKTAMKHMQRSEHTEQVYVCQWLRRRGIIHCSIPNGAPMSFTQRAYMVAEGLTKGFPDLLIFNKPNKSYKARDVKGRECDLLYCGVALEMKREFGGVQSEAQKICQKALEENSWLYILAHGADEAIKELTKLGY